MCKSIESYGKLLVEEEKEKIIKNHLLENDGYSIEKIARLCNTSVDFVKEVQEELLALV